MLECVLELHDQVNCRFKGLDPATRKKFTELLKFEVPYAKHTPKFKLGRWDGKIAFGSIGGGTYINLIERVLPLIMAAGYDITLDDKRPSFDFVFPTITPDVLSHITWPAGHRFAGQPIVLEEHQVEALNTYVQNPQCLQSISTGAGKTIMSACMSMLAEPYGRSLVIVPSKSLVEQTEEDYRNVGLDVGVYYGDRKEWQHKHTICTWQSLSVFAKKTKAGDADVPISQFFAGVVCVIVDECHTIRGQELRDLLCGPAAHIPLRWGMTGTIPKADFEFIPLVASIGPVLGKVSAAQLQEKGFLANCDIEILQLDDSHVEFSSYPDENKFITSDPTRLDFIGQYCTALAETGNTLVLVDRIETGDYLKQIIPDSVFVNGTVKTKDRKKEYKAVEIVDGKTIIATYGVAAVGINAPRLFNVVMISSGTSFVRVIQSIGRILRKAQDKDYAKVIDLTSNLKFSKKHLTKRKEFYDEAGYPYKLSKVKYR